MTELEQCYELGKGTRPLFNADKLRLKLFEYTYSSGNLFELGKLADVASSL